MSEWKVGSFAVVLTNEPHGALVYSGDIIRVTNIINDVRFDFVPVDKERLSHLMRLDSWNGHYENFRLLDIKELTELDKLIYNIK